MDMIKKHYKSIVLTHSINNNNNNNSNDKKQTITLPWILKIGPKI